MCGITGILSRELSPERWERLLKAMTNSLEHRGPDDCGCWYDTSAGVGLGHRRLSIIDLSKNGSQPMQSKGGRYLISYNGEVYNYIELRKKLEKFGHLFIGHSDTEVLLSAIEQWGLFKAVNRFNGMFSIALWDRDEQVLHLIRDRLGIKPLYYGRVKNTFAFASELKALKACSLFPTDINRNALTLMLRHNCIPSPYTIYKNIYKLLPGYILSIDHKQDDKSELTQYWSVRDTALNGFSKPINGSTREITDRLEKLLKNAVEMRMIADVPLGAFLSGGVDSSTVVALMQAHSCRPIKTFSVGFHETAFSEAEDARRIAKHLGTDHAELYVTASDALAVIPKLPRLYDEPFSDSSQIPTFLISELAQKHVTVSLSGDGGDEIFGGYNRYLWGPSIWRKTGWMPRAFKGLIANMLTGLLPETWDRLYQIIQYNLPEDYRQRNPGEKIHKLAQAIRAENPKDMYRSIVSHWKNPAEIVIDGKEPSTVLTKTTLWTEPHNFTAYMMLLDTLTYLQDDILTKLDRAGMGVSLEARVPLLDHRVVEFAWRIPLSMKARQKQSKWILRQVLYKYVPRELIERPKWGFGIPIGDWLQNQLRDWTETLLSEKRLKEDGFFDPRPIRRMWKEHLSGRGNWQNHLWDILMFQGWLDHNR